MASHGAAKEISVGSVGASHKTLVGAGLLGRLPEVLAASVSAHRVVVISDDNVGPLYGPGLVERFRASGSDATLLTFPAGEASKTRETWSTLTDAMLSGGVGRDSCVVAMGGGVATDVGGFVAATYMRGVSLVLVPTSYLAMVDASIGGKTGVDTRHGKNLVGAFHLPRLVVVDPEVLATLPGSQRAQGLVEAFKHGAILDESYFDSLAQSVPELLAAEPEAATRIVTRSIELKAGVVAEDVREAGRRQILNFGHTVGHALEAASDFALGHGDAIRIGMVVEAAIGERLSLTEAGTAERLDSVMGRLSERARVALDMDRVVSFVGADKKSREGRARYVLLRRLGEVHPGEGWTHGVPDAIVIDALQERLATR